jgi:hypothetical protein
VRPLKNRRKSKQRSEEHLIDAAGQQLLRQCLPRHWVLREYRPDYGLDFALEVFRPTRDSAKRRRRTYETLGEHLFIQLKAASSAEAWPLKLYGRYNVEKKAEDLNKKDQVGELDTIRYLIDTSELLTIERMGVGVPVLLIIADLRQERCYFVCLNDYIDKILVPRFGNYKNAKNRTIHIPKRNEFGLGNTEYSPLRWYAKRPKLFSAFQRFVFQYIELEYAFSTPDFLPMARYFASRIINYDFWDDTEMWFPIAFYAAAIRRFVETGKPGLMKTVGSWLVNKFRDDEKAQNRMLEHTQRQDVLELWRRLSVLPRNYEDVCREWFLPTALGFSASYDEDLAICADTARPGKAGNASAAKTERRLTE